MFSQILLYFIVSVLAVCHNCLNSRSTSSYSLTNFITADSNKLQEKETTSYISVKAAGVVGDGETDVTNKIQQLLNKHDSVFFPKGNYLISSELTLKSNQVVYGDSGTNIMTKTVVPFNFFQVRSKENVKIRSLNFNCPAGTKAEDYAVKIINSRTIVVSHLVATNCGLVTSPEDVSYEETGNYEKGKPLTGSKDISIDGCKGTGSLAAMTGRTRGILMQFVKNWKVTNCILKNYVQGVQWWGGDSNPERNGDTNNVRKTSNGLVENVTVSDIAGGGIWGSMGENIVIKSCRVSKCGDVGIDFEGCFNSTATNNYVKDCKNGCLATFHYNKNISFDHNIVRQRDPRFPLACIYNSTQRQDNGLVSLANNHFSVDKGVGVILQQGPSNYIVFEKNMLLNVVLNLTFNNNKIIEIRNNTFKLTKPLGDYNYVIKAGLTNFGGKLTVEDNSILSTVSQRKEVFAINPFQGDYNSSPLNIIKDNRITGVPNKYKIEWNGTNPGVTSKTYIISSTRVLPAEIKKVDLSGKPSEVYLNNIKQ